MCSSREGKSGKLGGKILGCRELVVLHDADGHPLKASTHRGDYHLTIGWTLDASLLRASNRFGSDASFVVVDREGMAAEFLVQLQQEGRQIVTLLRSDQYEGEGSFQEVGQWHAFRSNRRGEVICEVASARFTLSRPDPADPEITVEVALIRDWRKFLPVEGNGEATDAPNWLADLSDEQKRFWEEGWQALPAPAPQTTRHSHPSDYDGTRYGSGSIGTNVLQTLELSGKRHSRLVDSTQFGHQSRLCKRTGCQRETLSKRQEVVQGRIRRLEQLAQASRARLTDLQEKAQHLREQMDTYEQQSLELLLQVTTFEITDQTEERAYFPDPRTTTRSRMAGAKASS
jgi:hypothetical protein